jgi:hypothetical protein
MKLKKILTGLRITAVRQNTRPFVRGASILKKIPQRHLRSRGSILIKVDGIGILI